jgi:hypothetical protein
LFFSIMFPFFSCSFIFCILFTFPISCLQTIWLIVYFSSFHYNFLILLQPLGIALFSIVLYLYSNTLVICLPEALKLHSLSLHPPSSLCGDCSPQWTNRLKMNKFQNRGTRNMTTRLKAKKLTTEKWKIT